MQVAIRSNLQLPSIQKCTLAAILTAWRGNIGNGAALRLDALSDMSTTRTKILHDRCTMCICLEQLYYFVIGHDYAAPNASTRTRIKLATKHFKCSFSITILVNGTSGISISSHSLAAPRPQLVMDVVPLVPVVVLHLRFALLLRY